MADSKKYKTNFLSFGVSEINMDLTNNLCFKFQSDSIKLLTGYNNFTDTEKFTENFFQNGKYTKKIS